MENSQKPLANVRSGICNLNKFIIPHFCIFWKILLNINKFKTPILYLKLMNDS